MTRAATTRLRAAATATLSVHAAKTCVAIVAAAPVSARVDAALAAAPHEHASSASLLVHAGAADPSGLLPGLVTTAAAFMLLTPLLSLFWISALHDRAAPLLAHLRSAAARYGFASAVLAAEMVVLCGSTAAVCALPWLALVALPLCSWCATVSDRALALRVARPLGGLVLAREALRRTGPRLVLLRAAYGAGALALGALAACAPLALREHAAVALVASQALALAATLARGHFLARVVVLSE